MNKLLWLLATTPAFAALMPMPAKFVPGVGSLKIDSSFAVEARGYSDARLKRAMSRLVARLSRQTGIEIRGGKTALWIECRARGPEYPKINEDESYKLDISSDSARITAPTVTGALRGMETFAQLVEQGPDGFTAHGVHIEDLPWSNWRGLMLDVSRHWMPLPVILRNLDAMAAVKLNVFHWHLSDDQGFRVESRRFPKLQGLGSDGHFYTQEQVRQVVEYAADRGIRVIPEFDMPGHTTSWFVGYPELASAPGPYQIERKWGIFQPLMDPSREETYAFLDAFIGEMAALFPDPCFHIGGDEVDATQWKQSKSIQAWAARNHLKDARAIQGYFTRRVEKLIEKHGKIMIGWDEVFEAGNHLSRRTVIQSWRGQASLAAAARAGHRGVLSFGYYLDHLQPAWAYYSVDPWGGAAASLTPEQKALILGGEACMWSEYVDSETVDSRIWPAAAAIAERLWSPLPDEIEESFYDRLESTSRALDWVGLRHRINYQPMLERIAGEGAAGPLRVLADASEATGIEVRRDARQYTSLVPLNRFVDAVRPESTSIRRLELAARQIVATPDPSPRDMAELRATLTAWAENDARLQPKGELAGLSKNLSLLGSIGLRTLDYLQTGQAPPNGWISQQIAALNTLEKPKAEVNLAAVRPIRILLEGAARQHGDGSNK
ncbi:MAG TPA: beta-N-acetylhexosaminidase [Bryobacteraceae bacterium]|nr:beta-N-acetylhexosaminidase [Bryobacteraceae bacterium]